MAQVHSRKDSTESTGTLGSDQSAESVSSTFSTASKASEIYKNPKGDIERLQDTIKEQDLGRYISKCEHLISCLSNSDENEIKFSGSKLELDRVMKGMLEHAVGIEGKKYVLAAILSCESKAEGETDHERLPDLVNNLKAVAETWAYYLLFIFKAGPGSRKTQSKMLKDDVKRRDGYQCVITGWLDVENLYDRNGLATDLEVAHILRRATATFTKDVSGSAASTFDILRNFTGLPAALIENLKDHADHVANCITLLSPAHYEWDKYGFCLKPTEEDHVYKIHYFTDLAQDAIEGLRQGTAGELVRFSDRSDEFLPYKCQRTDEEDGARPSTRSGSGSQSSSKFELPSKTFIAIHAAVAGVLNMSGAGKFFDELLSKYDEDDEKNPPVRCWDDLEKKARDYHLSEQVQRIMIGDATPA
ncbi:hypothetical protein NLJ89_g4235 [Agrocybe chaxingu]|uniref:HNH nuclease domain-containing protein n=1 Tax=Agrocybe chaxingu TaxID=84603 RepID=A0A9W8MW47_9AGAR|nr:hypothetical protein NLJ89_g4235 [Agrocybe chaxingu]